MLTRLSSTWRAVDFASSPGKMVNELVQVYAIGNDICAISIRASERKLSASVEPCLVVRKIKRPSTTLETQS